MDNKVLDEAVEVAGAILADHALDGDGPNEKALRTALLAGVKVLLGEPAAWQKPSYAEAIVSAEHVAWYAKKYPYRATYGGWIPLYAPSLGEGDAG